MGANPDHPEPAPSSTAGSVPHPTGNDNSISRETARPSTNLPRLPSKDDGSEAQSEQRVGLLFPNICAKH
eukprot:8993231-Prorocentrum_lima.AAC.1